MDNNMTEDKNENTGSKGSSKYWLTLDQWRKDPQFQKMAEQEFVSSPMSLGSDSEGGWYHGNEDDPSERVLRVEFDLDIEPF